MVGEEGLPEVLGINVNGDLEDDEIVCIAKRCKIPIWIGENPTFKDPFYVADLIADHVDFLGFGVVTVERGCRDILRSFENLVRKHRDTTFALGIGAGRLRGSIGVRKVLDCLRYLRSRVNFLFCGCSGPILTRFSSKIVDGILFNYSQLEYLNWMYRYLRRDVIKVSYAPSLLLPSKLEYDLLIACAIVSCSNEVFAKKFGYKKMFDEFMRLNFEKVVEGRKRNGKIPDEILKYKKILIDNFAIAGSFDFLVRKISELLKLCDHVVLGDPFFRDKSSIKIVNRLLDSLDASRVS